VTLTQLDVPRFGSWLDVLDAHDEVLDFLLEPGDYTDWGRLTPRAGGSQSRPRTIRYYGGGSESARHPVKRSPGAQARIDSFLFEDEGVQDWLLHGLWIHSPSLNCSIQRGAGNITVDFCLIEYAFKYSVRIRDTANCTIQRCVIREAHNIKPAEETDDPEESDEIDDSSGVQIGSRKRGVSGIRILDNEIYNVGDGIQLTHSPDDPLLPIEAVIEGNDLYLESSRYLESPPNTTLDENAIDLKAGADAPSSTVIRRNRMWGMRFNAKPDRSAAGEIIALHKYCRNVLIEDNIMGDAPRCVSDIRWPASQDIDPRKSRHVVFCNNQVYEIRDFAAEDVGAIARPVTSGFVFSGNHFARSTFMADVTPPSGYEGVPVFVGNVLLQVHCIQRKDASNACAEPSVEYDLALNSRIRFARRGFDTYQRKRWTGPEFAKGAKPARITLDDGGTLAPP
jgi:hypothetical protein